MSRNKNELNIQAGEKRGIGRRDGKNGARTQCGLPAILVSRRQYRNSIIESHDQDGCTTKLRIAATGYHLRDFNWKGT